LVKIFIIFPSFGVNSGPCESNVFKFYFFYTVNYTEIINSGK
jgi:hypothetical protein